MWHRALAGCLLAQSMVLASPAFAMEWLSGSELQEHCDTLTDDDADSRDAVICVAFIQGFLAGSDAVSNPPDAGASGNESFSERAARTRIGSRLDRLESLQHEPHCAGHDVPVRAVVEQIQAYLDDHGDDRGLTANQLVHRALVHGFPCGE